MHYTVLHLSDLEVDLLIEGLQCLYDDLLDLSVAPDCVNLLLERLSSLPFVEDPDIDFHIKFERYANG